MKILFLQNTANATGGIVNVNITLANKLIKDKNEVFIYSVRKSIQDDNVKYPEDIKIKTINEKGIWNCPLYSDAKNLILKGKIVRGVKKILERLRYDKKLNKDYRILSYEIKKINPDIIINSHYELLDAIPKEYLHTTINHYHTNFNQVVKHRSQIKVFKRYQHKIGKFVWLTKQTEKEAVEFGIKNSVHIYNPIRFKCLNNEEVEKKIVFLGRFSEEKRLGMAIKIFKELISENNIIDWEFDIYGMGTLDENIKREIEESKYINLKGIAKKPEDILSKYYTMIMTSEFEGFPLVVIEANECGVPVIAFDFGESIGEVINNQTGVVVEQNNTKMFKKQLLEMMQNIEIRNNKSKMAKEFANSFKIENIINRWYEIFSEIKQKERNIK